MKKFIFTAVSIILLLSASAHSQSLNVAVVDMKRILKESEAAKDLKGKLQSSKSKYIEKRKNEEDNIRLAQETLISQKNVVAADIFQQKQQEFQDNLIKAQRRVQEKAAKLENSFKTELVKVQTKTLEIVSELSKQNSYDLVLDYNQILYNDSKLDITDEVMKRLNKSLSKVGSID
jgi:Skp family chaperone for outer membrane proteins